MAPHRRQRPTRRVEGSCDRAGDSTTGPRAELLRHRRIVRRGARLAAHWNPQRLGYGHTHRCGRRPPRCVEEGIEKGSRMDIKRSGTQPPEPARALGVSVTFEPGARTAWHTHPLGQTLIVTAGCGLVQSRGGPIKKICPGDVVWCPPGEKHWHGATSTTAMTHIAILEHLNGKTVDWMEKVSDEQYQAALQ